MFLHSFNIHANTTVQHCAFIKVLFCRNMYLRSCMMLAKQNGGNMAQRCCVCLNNKPISISAAQQDVTKISFMSQIPIVGHDSSVGIATRYGLDDPGIECRWGGRDFPHLSRPSLGPTEPPIQWVPGHSRGKSGRGVALNTHSYIEPRLKKE